MGVSVAEVRSTTEDIEALPEWHRAELIDGEIFDMAAPSVTHQRLVTSLTVQIGTHLREAHRACEVFPGPFGVYLFDDAFNLLEPDVTVVCDPEKLDDRGCHGAPDWVIEVVSPSTRQRDYMKKLFLYRDAGVRLYWIVDPLIREVAVYDFQSSETERYRFGQAVPVAICPGFEITVDA